MEIKLFLYKPLSGIFGPIEYNRWYIAEQGTTDGSDEVYVSVPLIGPNGADYNITFWDDEHKEYFLTLDELRDKKISNILYEN